MKKSLLAVVCLLSSAFMFSALAAENLINNSEFKLNAKGIPVEWFKLNKIGFEAKETGGGPQGDKAYITFTTDAKRPTGSLRQVLKKRVFPGKTYRLSGWVKGENFKAADYGVMVINDKWRGSCGVRRFKFKGDKWLHFSKEFQIPANWTNVILAIFVTKGETGKFSAAGVELVEVVK